MPAARRTSSSERLGIDANERAQHEADEDDVVELAGDRNEVRDEIERQREIADQPDQQKLASTRHSRIANQTPHQHDAVRDEPGKCTRVSTPPHQNEAAHRHRQHNEKHT